MLNEDSINALLRLYEDSIEALMLYQGSVCAAFSQSLACQSRLSRLLRLFKGSIKALLRLHQGSIKALLRLYEGSIKAL